MASVMSTVLSRLNAFLDSELEQILCFDSAIDAEKFAFGEVRHLPDTAGGGHDQKLHGWPDDPEPQPGAVRSGR